MIAVSKFFEIPTVTEVNEDPIVVVGHSKKINPGSNFIGFQFAMLYPVINRSPGNLEYLANLCKLE